MDPFHTKLLGAVIAGLTVLAGGYGAYQGNLLSSDPSARPDPWTGTMAREQRKEIVAHHEEDIRHMMEVVREIQLQVRELEACKARVEVELLQAREDRREILEILNVVHPRAGSKARNRVSPRTSTHPFESTFTDGFSDEPDE